MNNAKRLARRTTRFWSKVEKTDSCWLWTAGLFQKTGYGAFWDKDTNRLAHRLAYELLVGPIPEGMQIDHLCRVRRCVRPDHLESVTPQINNARSSSPSALNAVKTHCVAGHPLSDDNVYVPPTGGRSCRECGRQRWRQYDAKRKAVLT